MLKSTNGKIEASLAWIAKDVVEGASQVPIEAIKPPFELITEGITKEKVLLWLNLL